ncbi:RNA polymerase sigma factor [Parapedobacter sp. GCM10030251]
MHYDSDQGLIEALRVGERNAYEQLVSEHSKRLLQAAFNRLDSKFDAEDMVQDLLMELWEKRETLTIEGGALSAYLNVALRNRIFTHFRRAALHKRAVRHLLEQMETMQSSILETLVRQDMETLLSEAVSELPENMQKIFILRGEDYSLKEIAKALGLAEQTVKGYSSEMIRRLHRTLAARQPGLDRSFLIVLTYLLTKN